MGTDELGIQHMPHRIRGDVLDTPLVAENYGVHKNQHAMGRFGGRVVLQVCHRSWVISPVCQASTEVTDPVYLIHSLGKFCSFVDLEISSSA